MGPIDKNVERRGNAPEDYIQVFKHFGVSHVIRLNEVKYDRQKFIKQGINHTDLYFIDGSTPSDVSSQLYLCVTSSKSCMTSWESVSKRREAWLCIAKQA